jgi:valyl-tRNA synthetase
VPARFEKTFKQWMENIEDWCISRQLWWGHQYTSMVSIKKQEKSMWAWKIHLQIRKHWKQDEDVLDTWFSSCFMAIFNNGLARRKRVNSMERYFPTDTLVTGYDIIFFWVARMIFQTLEFAMAMIDHLKMF